MAVQIVRKESGRIVEVRHIGSGHTETEVRALVVLARQKLHENQLPLLPTLVAQSFASELRLRRSNSKLLWEVLAEQYERLGFGGLNDADFERLCLARLVEPTSKLDSLRVLADLGLFGLTKNRLYRCLQRVVALNYRSALAEFCFRYVAKQGLTLVLYDVTTLYFEAHEEDDYRQSGMSKERRLEPQIVVGLLVNQAGFPLDIQSFTGKKAETKTILPVLGAFKQKHALTDVTVVADAAMLSAANLEALAQAGYSYIVGSRLQKIPYDIAEYQKTAELMNNQIIVTELSDRRVIYQYREKRAALDRRNIEKQILKAEKILAGKAPATKAKFLNLKTKEKALNQTLIAKARALAGIKGYVTNLKAPPELIIRHYHQLYQVEASFRMAKSDLKARPIFHRKQDAIEAHLTLVFAALALGRHLEALTGVSLKQLVKQLRPIRTGVVALGNQEYLAEPEIPEDIHSLLAKLRSGH